MEQWDDKLNEIKRQIKAGCKSQPVTAREFIGWFGCQRRSYGNVKFIRDRLKEYQMTTDPDFEYAFIDGPISVVQRKRVPQAQEVVSAVSDPTYRIGQLASANKRLVSVKPDDSLEKAVTLMVTHDFSQLPVMTTETVVKGVITWASLGSQKHFGRECSQVQECMVPHREVGWDAPLLSAIDDIVKNQYVLVRDAAHKYSGIVTTSDLSQEFRQLGEPFLLLGEIENYIRRMIADKYTLAELTTARDPNDSGREIHGISDLTLGECLRLIENPGNWGKLALAVDRDVFVGKLQEIRQVRNEVMHFNPDPIASDDIGKLRDCVHLMQSLARVKAI